MTFDARGPCGRLARVLRVGLTGGIASGKSVVCALLAEKGVVVIDSDVLARAVVAQGTSGLTEVVKAFGPKVLAADGSLDRPALGALVFADAEARRRLEQIIHPLVRARAAELEAEAAHDAVVVHDIPLLVETGQAESFDVVVVVDVPPDSQLARLAEDRGMAAHEAQARIASQADRDTRLAAATYVVVNDGTRAQLAERVDALWVELQAAQSAEHPPRGSAGIHGGTG